MLKWFSAQKARDSQDDSQNGASGVTDDPFAAIGFDKQRKEIYSVSRSVYLPRVSLKIRNVDCFRPSSRGINPLYSDENKCPTVQHPPHIFSKCVKSTLLSRQNPTSSKKSISSGYGGSQVGSSNYMNELKLREDAVAILEQNANYVKSIKISMSDKNTKRISRISSPHLSGSSGAGTLTTIPEGRVDFTIPKPIWPKLDIQSEMYDSLVDEAMMLYTNSSIRNRDNNCNGEEQSLKDVLLDLVNGINATMQGKGSSAEEMLKNVNERILLSIEALKNSTEEEIRKLCFNISHSKNVLSVVRAFGNSSGSTSGNSSQTTPEWTSGRERTTSSEVEDIYHIPSGSSSSGFSDSLKVFDINQLPVFVHEDLSNVPNGVRNAMIYGTLYRGNYKNPAEKHSDKEKCVRKQKKGLLQACNDNKPSVWEQYYGVNVVPEGIKAVYSSNPADIPVYIPGPSIFAKHGHNTIQPTQEILSSAHLLFSLT